MEVFVIERSASQHSRGVLLARWVGDMDIERRPELTWLVEEFERSGCADIVIDMRHVGFLDSSGVTALAQLQGVAGTRGGFVTVTSPSTAVRKVLAITGVELLVHALEAPVDIELALEDATS